MKSDYRQLQNRHPVLICSLPLRSSNRSQANAGSALSMEMPTDLPSFKAASACREKDIAGKQRQPELVVPIFPSVDSRVERKEDLELLTRKNVRDRLFMLMASIECVPGMVTVSVRRLD
jgi:hypothetical protein